ncbi:MAG: tetratricopeptide repeat protein [Desulfobacteraceae bacterium]
MKRHTLELARLYEKQARYQKALESYQELLKQSPSSGELAHAVERVTPLAREEESAASKKRLAGVLNQWVSLLVLQQRTTGLLACTSARQDGM